MINLELNKDKHYLVAVSFGPDSMALLNMLYLERFHISVAHVNYHRRPESDLEQTGLEQYCLDRDIPLFVLDIPKQDVKGNFQAWAREARYRFFKEISDEIKADALLTAHQLDDHLETALMQQKRKTMALCMGICRETTIDGMNIIRPLLHLRKAELLEYCQTHDVAYAIDSSNLTDHYERNRVRHHVLAKLGQHDIERLVEQASSYNARIQGLLETHKEITQKKRILASSITAYDDVELFVALHLLISTRCPSCPISKTLRAEVRQIAQKSDSYWRRHLRGNIWLVRNYEWLEIVSEDTGKPYSFTYEHPSLADTPYFYMDFRSGSHRQLVLENHYPITIRSPLPDDAIIINGTSRSLRRLFIDWKLPRHRRRSWPVVLDKNGIIVFVPRYQKDFVPDASSRFYAK